MLASFAGFTIPQFGGWLSNSQLNLQICLYLVLSAASTWVIQFAGNPKGDRNGPVDEVAGSANSYLFLAALNAAAALPLAVAPHTVSRH